MLARVATRITEAGAIACGLALLIASAPRAPARERPRPHVAGCAGWEPIAPRPPAQPKRAVDDPLGDGREIIAASGSEADAWAVVRHERDVGVPDSDGVVRGWGRVTAYELWRRRVGAWAAVLAPIGLTPRDAIYGLVVQGGAGWAALGGETTSALLSIDHGKLRTVRAERTGF